MKVLYQNVGEKIGPYSAMSLDSKDKIISGRNGFIFLSGDGSRIGVMLIGRRSDFAVVEKIKYYDFNQLERWVLRIDVPTRVSERLHYANNPNARWQAL